MMGGRIYLDESYNSDLEGCPGTRFVIELSPRHKPMAKDDLDKLGEDHNITVETPDAATASTSSSTSSCSEDAPAKEEVPLPEHFKALFVDDDIILRKLFCRSVKKVVPNWSVREASCGEAALEMLHRNEEFDIIFLDQYMTSTEKCLLGTEAARAMRTAGYKGIICGLSANDMEQSFISAGADAFIMKPFPCISEQMLAEFRRLLFSRELRTAAEEKPEPLK
jgi:CheY-like chemotaxis protein